MASIGAGWPGADGVTLANERTVEVSLGARPAVVNLPGKGFILPRGSGGRLPMLTQLDLRVAYSKQFAKRYRVELSLDVFNVLNLQQVTSIDQNYTVDRVLPMVGGTYESLKNLTTTSGTVPRLNPNYGQPTGYQAPLSMRIGARFAF